MMAFGPRLRAILGLDRTGFSRGLKGAEAEVDSFGRKVKGAGAALSAALGIGIPAVTAASIANHLRSTVRGIAEVGDAAKRAGMSLQAFQEWKFVAEQNRIGIDAMVDGFKELNLRADEFITTGGGSAADAFKRLGFNAADLREKLKDPSALMLELIQRMKSLDRAARIRVSDEIFGGSAGERFVELIDQGAEGLQRTIDLGHQMGRVMDAEMVAKAQELDRRFELVAGRIASLNRTLVGGALEVAEAWAKMRTENKAAAAILESMVPGLRAAGAGVSAVFESGSVVKMRSEVEVLSEQLEALRREMIDAGSELVGTLRADALALGDLGREVDKIAFRDLFREVDALVDRAADMDASEFQAQLADLNVKAAELYRNLGDVDGISTADAVGQINAISRAIQTAIGLAASLRSHLPGGAAAIAAGAALVEDPRIQGDMGWRAIEGGPAMRPKRVPIDFNPGYKPPGKGGGGKRDRGDEFQRSLTAVREETAALQAEAVVLAAVASGNRQLGDAMEFARKKAELMNAARKAGTAITPELTAMIEAEAMAYMQAGLEAEGARERIEGMRAAGERGADAMSNLFYGIISGATSGKQAVAQLLAEIAKIQMQKAFLGLSKSGGGGGFFGWLGGLLTGNARGTNNFAGGLTRINELGGEIVNLPSGTQVIPHDISKRMADGAGSRTTVEIRLSPELIGQILSQAGGQAVFISQQATATGLRENTRAMPGQIAALTARRD